MRAHTQNGLLIQVNRHVCGGAHQKTWDLLNCEYTQQVPAIFPANKLMETVLRLKWRENPGGCWVIEPGAKTLDEMIRDVKRGILFARFSGGNPSPNGDFSGVAINSYYIEEDHVSGH